MFSEYKPLRSIDESREKLSRLAQQVENTDEELAECILDVLASRGGKRWKRLGGLDLITDPGGQGMLVKIGFLKRAKNYPANAFMFINEQTSGRRYEYEVWEKEKKNIGIDGNRVILGVHVSLCAFSRPRVIPAGSLYSGLAAAKLIGILAKAHSETPIEPLPKTAYEQATEYAWDKFKSDNS